MAMPKSIVLWCILSVFTVPLFGQCEKLGGFARQACEAGSRKSNTVVSGKSDALTTRFTDSVYSDTLPPELNSKAFQPLTKLERADDGTFVVRPGLYEAFVESFPLDPVDIAGNPGGFYPEPLKGKRAKIIGDVLKLSELHPEIPQADIEQLLVALAQGINLEQMPPRAQQAASTILSHEDIGQLRGASAGKTGNVLKGWFNDKVMNNPKVRQQISVLQGKVNKADQQYGISGVVNGLNTQSGSAPQYPSVVVARGTWVKVADGYYVRYLPEGNNKMHVQIFVPDVIEFNNDVHPFGFNPTEYLAVYVGAPQLRIGISMRPAH